MASILPQSCKPISESQAKYNTRIKYFPNEVKLTCFSRPVFNPYKCERHYTDKEREARERQQKRKQKEKQEQNECLHDLLEFGWITQSELDSLKVRNDNCKRAKDKAYEIAYANEFQYFITMTLNKDKIDRYDVQKVCKSMKKWLSNMVSRYDMKYLIFPERHKDGAIHFHGLFSGDLRLVDSGRKTVNGQQIFNLDNWALGYTSAVQLVGDYSRVANYIMKYITKEQGRVFKHYYYAGGKLERNVPTRYENIDFGSVDAEAIPIFNACLAVKYRTEAVEQ